MDEIINQFEDIYIQIGQLNQKVVGLWSSDILFSWRWWFSLSLMIVPWILWFRLRPTQGSGPILLSGLIASMIASILDSIGVAYGVWSYPIIILPYLHSFYVPWDVTVIPVSIMLFLQLLFSLGAAFIAEPLLVWMKIYHPITWNFLIKIADITLENDHILGYARQSIELASTTLNRTTKTEGQISEASEPRRLRLAREHA